MPILYCLKQKSSVCISFLIIIKGMSNFDDKSNMNLHEECLIKYLINPLELFYTTELLKNNNLILEKKFMGNDCVNAVENGKWKVESY